VLLIYKNFAKNNCESSKLAIPDDNILNLLESTSNLTPRGLASPILTGNEELDQ